LTQVIKAVVGRFAPIHLPPVFKVNNNNPLHEKIQDNFTSPAYYRSYAALCSVLCLIAARLSFMRKKSIRTSQ
jgi:hypothetical protein